MTVDIGRGDIGRGDIWLVDFGADPTDPEQAFMRPAVVVSHERLHDPRLKMCVVVPGTSTIRRVSLHLVVEPDADNGLDAMKAFQVEQVRSVSVARLDRCLGRLGSIGVAQLDELLRTVLDL